MTIIFAIASTILGSIIGAGFSTGQEVLYFFSQHKEASFLYIGVTSILLFLILLYFSDNIVKSGILDKILRLYIMLFSFITLIVMFSAFGQLGVEFLRVNKYLFTLFCFALSIVIYSCGFVSVINTNKIVVSLLIGSIFLVYLGKAFSSQAFLQFDILINNSDKYHFFTTLSPILYATYNSLLAFPVVYELKSRFKNREMKIGIGIASFLIFVLLNLINLIILSDPSSQKSQMPLLKATGNYLLQAILILCTFLEILTTVLANYIGLSYSLKKSEIKNVVIIIALILGFNDFKQLLINLYSFMGYLGIAVILLMVLFTFLKRK